MCKPASSLRSYIVTAFQSFMYSPALEVYKRKICIRAEMNEKTAPSGAVHEEKVCQIVLRIFPV